MMTMTLKELCILYRIYSSDIVKCCNARSEYLRRNKGKYRFERLDESDFSCLRVYLLCDILAIYEYLAVANKEQVQDWFVLYTGVSCPLEECDNYRVMIENGASTEDAASVVGYMLESSIEPFKRRGIPASCFDYTV